MTLVTPKPLIQDCIGLESYVRVSGDLGGRGHASPWCVDCAGGMSRRDAGKPLLTGLQELFRPTVIEVLIEPFLATEFSDAVLAAKALQHDADLVLG